LNAAIKGEAALYTISGWELSLEKD